MGIKISEMGLIDKTESNPWYVLKRFMFLKSKIIFLNKENLAELEGYKAKIELGEGLLEYNEIKITLTGFSPKSAKNLFNKLKALPKNEIYSGETKK